MIKILGIETKLSGDQVWLVALRMRLVYAGVKFAGILNLVNRFKFFAISELMTNYIDQTLSICPLDHIRKI